MRNDAHPGGKARHARTRAVIAALAIAGAITESRATENPGSDDEARRPYRFTTGLEHRSGTYGGARRTEEVRIPLQLTYRGPEWILVARTHFTDVSGYALAIDRDAPEEPGAAAGARSGLPRSDAGMDDLYLSAFHRTASPKTALLGVENGVRIKVPLSSGEQCLITNGEVDVTLESRLFRRFGRIEPSLAAGITRRGDPVRRNADCEAIPGSRIDLRDPLHMRLGIDARLTRNLDVEGSYLYREALRPGGPPLRLARITFEIRLTSDVRASVYGGRAFSDAGPDWIGGLTLGVRF